MAWADLRLYGRSAERDELLGSRMCRTVLSYGYGRLELVAQYFSRVSWAEIGPRLLGLPPAVCLWLRTLPIARSWRVAYSAEIWSYRPNDRAEGRSIDSYFDLGICR